MQKKQPNSTYGCIVSAKENNLIQPNVECRMSNVECRMDNDNISANADTSNSTRLDTAAERLDIKKFIEFFNTEMDKAGALIPRVRSIDGQRKQFLEARTREYGKEAVAEAVRKAAASDFLNGGGNTGFKADFGWIFRPNNFPKVLEGNYDDRHESIRERQGDKRRGVEVTATKASDYEGRFTD